MLSILSRNLVTAAACIAFVAGCGSGGRSGTTPVARDGAPTADDGRLTPAASGDTAGLWRELSDGRAKAIRGVRAYAADREKFESALETAPEEYSGAEGALVTMPLPDGTFTRVRLLRSSLLSPELQAQHPELQTYVVRGVDDPTMTGRLARIPAGIHAMLLSSRGAVVIAPSAGGAGEHVSYRLRGGGTRNLEHGALEPDAPPVVAPDDGVRQAATSTSWLTLASAYSSHGSKLRTYRLALNADAEFTAYVGGLPEVAAQFVTTVTDLNAFYEREVAIRFQLVYAMAYTDPATDPFTDDNTNAMLGENQADLDAKVGDANYDIGHLFATGGNVAGKSYPGTVCEKGWKGAAVSTARMPAPLDMAFSLDVVGHEMGHQLGASHTFSESVAGQFVAATAYEAGLGCSLMSYGTLCGGLEEGADFVYYLHAASVDQIIATGNAKSCGTQTDTGNQLPWIGAEPDCTAPLSTPLHLRSWGDDPDEDCHHEVAGCPPNHQHEELTYIWEQMDAAPEPVEGYPSPTATTGPIVTSWVPLPPGIDRSERIIPSLKSILEDAVDRWQVLPQVERTLHFRATVRDNRAGGGGRASVSTTVNISGAPLRITSPDRDQVAECGEDLAVLWEPGGSAAPSMQVGFETYDAEWSSGRVEGTTANTGSFTFKPWTATTHARVTLDPSPASCYLAYSQRFTVVDTQPPTVTAPATVTAECTSPGGTAVDIGKAAVADACDRLLEAKSDAPALFPLGHTYVLWTATDKAHNFDVDGQEVIVKDTTPPMLVPPPSVTVECASPAGTAVSLGQAIATDACDTLVLPTSDAPSLFPPGATTVHWTAVDDSGNKSTAATVVTVKDSVAPTLSCNAPVSIVPSSVPVSFASTSTDVCKGSLPVTISRYDCYSFNRLGKRITRECTIQIQGGTITIVDSGGIGAHIEWDISAADGSGNEATTTCHLIVVSKK